MVRARRKSEFIIIGLGRFGGGVATTLVELGHDVLGVDVNAKAVQEHRDLLTHAVEADSTDVETMRQLGAADFGTAVVAIGTDIEASILTTAPYSTSESRGLSRRPSRNRTGRSSSESARPGSSTRSATPASASGTASPAA